MVDVNSASLQLPGVTYYGIEATHSGMCKFDSPIAPGYRNVSTVIRQWVHEAPAMIQGRWEVEEEEKKARARNEIIERAKPFVTSPKVQSPDTFEHDPLTILKDRTTTQPLLLDRPEPLSPTFTEHLFVHPERFRPNSSFKGRGKELNDLHQMLKDQDRRDRGTSAVVIRAIPGGGKSHLAREYAFKFRREYPGGVFWIRAKSQDDLEEGFLKMARHEKIRPELQVDNASDLQNPRKAVRAVRKWLNRSEDWLLILDGVLSDTPHISHFVPNAQNTSLILTSTDSSIAGSHMFNNPQKLELGPLDEKDAQELLLEEMDRKKPWSPEDLNRALEAVRLMDCIPVAIHAAGRQLRATKEPLPKYIRSYKSRPRTGSLDAYKAVRAKLEERGEMAALNLVYLLSFFYERVPVEMLALGGCLDIQVTVQAANSSLGLKALDKRTPVRTHDSSGKRHSLNKTFTVLIAFALIDRDEINDIPSASAHSNSESSQQAPSSEPLDVLIMQSIVQSFFIQTLKKEDQLLFWLERAAAVFCKSYDEADTRIRRHAQVGLPDDYRRYKAHCKKLLGHIKRVSEPTAELLLAKEALQARLEDIQIQIFTLTEQIATNNSDDGDQGPRLSVFERTNSLTISGSTSTADSKNDSQGRHGRKLGDPYDDMLTLEESPLRHHMPYPYDSTIPAPGYVDDDDDVPWNMSSSQVEPPSPEEHRTVRRLAAKRYHDRAGAWRETKQKVIEPRVTLSNEKAEGSFFPVAMDSSEESSHGDPSSAKDRLSSIGSVKKRADTSDKPLDNEARVSRVGLVDSPRQGYISGSPESFSPQGTTQAPNMSRFNSQQKGSQQSIPTREENPFFETGKVPQPTVPHELSEWRPASSFGTGSMHSAGNPSNSYLGKENEAWPPAGLPVVVNTTSSLSPVPIGYDSTRSQHRTSDAAFVDGRLSTSPPGSHTGTLLPPFWRPTALHPDGYTSQPMSRNPSNSNPELATSQHSSPPGSTTTSQTLPIRRRRPSMAATEPSPRLSGFEAPQTSYQAWQQRHAEAEGTATAGGGSVILDRKPLSRESTGSEAVVDMERSTSSGGIRVNGQIIEFGYSPPKAGSVPRGIAEDDEEADMRGGTIGLGISGGARAGRYPVP